MRRLVVGLAIIDCCWTNHGMGNEIKHITALGPTLVGLGVTWIVGSTVWGTTVVGVEVSAVGLVTG